MATFIDARRVFLPLALVAGLILFPTLASPQNPPAKPAASGSAVAGADSARALSLFKQGKFDEACPLFLKVANAKPGNGPAWADLGLCELKRDNLEASIHASLLAVRHGDERTRKNAYFNLAKAGFSAPVPEGSQCAPIACRAEFACAEPLIMCAAGDKTEGQSFEAEMREIVIADQRQDFALEQRYLPSVGAPPARVTWKPFLPPPPGKAVAYIDPIIHFRLVVLERSQATGVNCPHQDCTDVDSEKPVNRRCTILAIDPDHGRVGYQCIDYDGLNSDETPVKTEIREAAFASMILELSN